jgi:glycopeptide antibiotics resistance protein
MSGGRREVLFNILAFIPFGILLTMNAPKISFLNKLAISILLSFSFESLQYLLAIGATDITDLITNSLGALLGISFYYLLIKVFSKAKVDLILTISFTILLIFTIIFIRQSIVLGTVRV